MAFFSAVFFSISAIDYLFDNRLGLGEPFKQGLTTIVELMLVMTGFMALTPWIALHISPLISPFFASFGCDPSLFAGIILAPDTGGAVLAKEIALNSEAGLFNGMIVASFLGDMICGGIPMALMKVRGSQCAAAVKGLLFAFVVLPFAILITGALCGFSFLMMWKNTWPVAIFAVILMLLFRFFSSAMVPFFSGFSLVLRGISIFGFCLSVIQESTGIVWLSGLTPLQEIFPVICQIGVFLGGILPFFSLVQRLLKRPLTALSKKLHVQSKSISDLVITTANHVPVLLSLDQLEESEITFVVAYAMLCSFTIGDFLAFALQYAPTIALPMMFGRLISGFLVLAVIATLRRISQKEKKQGISPDAST